MADEYIKRQYVEAAQYDACRECRETCEEFDGFYADCNQCLLYGVIEKVKEIPAADIAPVRHGRWEDTLFGWLCTSCREEQQYARRLRYCPNCGADMREVQSVD